MSELEHEAEELRQLWKSKSSSRSTRSDFLLPHSLLLNPEEEGAGEPAAARSPAVLKRWASERLMKATLAPGSPGGIHDHECSCVRRAEVVKYRGISLLNEVDAQYSALQVKYDELLRRCQLEEEEELGCKSLTSGAAAGRLSPADMEEFQDDGHQPEYKELFRKIFLRIQKTKDDLSKNRGSAAEATSQ